MRMTRTGRFAPALLAVLLVTACTGGGEGGAMPSAPAGREPDLTIEPLEAIDGAERHTAAGVGIDVPAGLEVRDQPVQDGVVQLQVLEPGASRLTAFATVASDVTAEPAAVDFSHETALAEAAAAGVIEESTETFPVGWEGFGYAVGSRLDLTVQDGGQERSLEALLVTAQAPGGDRIVTAYAEAEPGRLDGSVALEVLRTVRVGG